uniref:Proteasome subunit beta type-3 n=1 Tax=Myxobolus squamalis TaxID=59785 RepID=A0A6B2G0N3_MYXSQ
MSASSYNGGSVMVMKGRESFAIASDLRFGSQFQTISCNMEKVFKFNDHLYLGLAGLTTDIQTVYQKMLMNYNLYKLSEGVVPSPKIFTSMLSNKLYEHRFGPYFLEPVVGGFDPKTGDVFVSACDIIGSTSIIDDFAVFGTAINQLLGTCECLWKPNMDADELFETASQAMLNAIDRDALSGWGVVIYLVEKHKTTKSILKARMD